MALFPFRFSHRLYPAFAVCFACFQGTPKERITPASSHPLHYLPLVGGTTMRGLPALASLSRIVQRGKKHTSACED